MPDRPLTTPAPYRVHALPADFTTCWRSHNMEFDPSTCMVITPTAPFCPPGLSDPVCKECTGWLLLREMHKTWLDGGGERCDIRWFRAHHVGDNAFSVSMQEAARWRHWRTEL